MIHSDSQSQQSIHGIPVPLSLAQEIERALEMMRRARTAHLAQRKGEVVDLPEGRYELPEPLIYPLGRSSNGE